MNLTKEQLVNQCYEEYILDKFGDKPALYSFFKNHERRPLLAKNLGAELFKMELSRKIQLDEMKLRELLKSMVQQFCKLAVNAVEKQVHSNKTKIFDEFGNAKDAVSEEVELPEGVETVERVTTGA